MAAAVRYSRALVTAISSVALFGLVILSLSAGLVREPWDLMILVPILYICPIAGAFVALSFVKNDVDRGVSRWQIALGAFIALAFFAGGLWTISHLH
jgi:exosortase/archaeosortase